MKRTVEFHDEARAEVLQARMWYAARNRVAAKAFVMELKRAVESIGDAPEAWPTHVHGTRRCLFQRFPYAVIYRIRADDVQVVAVAHTHRRPGYWRAR